jgi:hypothetical protein
MQFGTPAQKTQKEVRNVSGGLPFVRQPQFCHRTRNDKIKIDGDAIRGYTVIASLNGI